ncbi:pilus assembly protein PilX [Psychrobacter glacincola]|uniref:Pilus assembly protein PilX n=1 Tax=Psychrobacter glacincola TaxID=56810 RepID=A0ABW1W726_9GAMM|nr:pilus assembly protein PilX [Psychrobacter glacincola]
MSTKKYNSYPKTMTQNSQQGVVLIVVLLFLVLIIFAGVIAVKRSTTDLRLATSDQINTLLLQSADNANQNIEQSINGSSDSTIYNAMLSSTGPFGHFILTPNNRNDEYVFCFRPRGQFFNINKTTISTPGADGLGTGNVLGNNNGYCNPATAADYVSKRNASMTQVSVSLSPNTAATELFSGYTKGQDISEVSSQAFVFDINSTSILPAYSGASGKAADCLKQTSRYATVTDKEKTIAGCMAKEGVPSTVLYEKADVENLSQRTKCVNFGTGSGKSGDLLCSLIAN